jgi:type I restriction enzyme S subunit
MIETKYKQTEFGMIPEDWQESNLSEVLKDFTTGATPYRGVKDFYSGNIPWVSSGELNYNYINDTNEHITEDARQKTNLKLYPSGTFLMAITGLEAEGTRGKCAILGTSATTNQSCLALSSTEKMSVEYWFYFYQFWSDWYAFRFSQGTKQQSYKADIVKKFPVVYPKDKQEQSRIAEALSDIDKLIASLSKMIEKKWLMKQGTMQQLLTGKKRLQGFAKSNNYKQTELGVISEEWEVKRLGEIAVLKSGKSVNFSIEKQGCYPCFGGNGIRTYISRYSHEGSFPIIGRQGELCGNVQFAKGRFFATEHAVVCRPISSIDAKWLFYQLIRANLNQYKTGNAQPGLSVEKINKEVLLPIPPIIEQSAIANILTTMDNEIESLEEERDKYIRVKEGMMQKLLTGQIRLVETEAKVVAMPKAKGANVHFKRSVLAAEIANRLCEEPTFGHVKMEKLIFLTEHLCHIDTGSHYHRDAAGPYDNTALRSIDKQMKQHQWFALTKKDKGYRYQPMDKRGDHKKYFDKYYASVLPMFDKVIETFKTSSTEQCEIVATLYSAWNDLLHRSQPFTDDDILNEVLNHWHDSKKRISSSRWQKALDWMRKNGFVPTLGNNN